MRNAGVLGVLIEIRDIAMLDRTSITMLAAQPLKESTHCGQSTAKSCFGQTKRTLGAGAESGFQALFEGNRPMDVKLLDPLEPGRGFNFFTVFSALSTVLVSARPAWRSQTAYLCFSRSFCSLIFAFTACPFQVSIQVRIGGIP